MRNLRSVQWYGFRWRCCNELMKRSLGYGKLWDRVIVWGDFLLFGYLKYAGYAPGSWTVRFSFRTHHNFWRARFHWRLRLGLTLRVTVRLVHQSLFAFIEDFLRDWLWDTCTETSIDTTVCRDAALEILWRYRFFLDVRLTGCIFTARVTAV